MTNFREQFDTILPRVETAITGMPGEPTTVPGLTKPKLIEFFRSFGSLLRYVDDEVGVDFAALAYSNTNVPQQILNIFANVANEGGNAPDYLVQNHIGTLLDLRNRLEAATNRTARPEDNPQAIRRRLTALDRIADQKLAEVDFAAEKADSLNNVVNSAAKALEEIETQRGKLDPLVKELENLRDRAKFIVEDGSDPEEPAIATIYSQINSRRSQIEEQARKAEEALKRANKTAASIDQIRGSAESLRKDAQSVLDNARNAMRGATQVGLAESFVGERDSKMWGLGIYGFALAVAVVGAIIFAVREVLPAIDTLTSAVANKSDRIGSLTTGLIIRSVLLAPFVFLGWFAALQYRRIDLLRIDYAAKAAAAKAYVGYKDEMKGDPKLVAALKAHLIQRFGEHPVRLVTKEHDETVPLEIFGLGSKVDGDQKKATTVGKTDDVAEG